MRVVDLPTQLRWLRVALIVTGILCFGFLPLTFVWPAGWSWYPRHSHSEHMIVVLYVVLGVFLLRASRDPLRNLSLIWFTVWSSVAHGALMAVQALSDASEHGHLIGDVPGLFLVAAVLAALTPRGVEVSSTGRMGGLAPPLTRAHAR
jgi:hypothetical protein